MSFVDNLVKQGVVTRKELASTRKEFLAKGVHPQEVERRLEQSLRNKSSNAKSVLKPSRVTENFRPHFRAETPQRKTEGFWRSNRLGLDLAQNDLHRQQTQKAVAYAKLRQALGTNEAGRMLQGSKTPEEKAAKKLKKKERREMAHKLVGQEEGSWWSPLLNLGADLIPKLLPMLLGMGSYESADDLPLKTGQEVSSNSLLAASSEGSKGSQVPYMHRKGDKVRVAHREYLGDVYSSTSSFTTSKFALNPGMEETFPWLAPVANQFTNYRILGMVADFVSQGSDYSNVAGLGYVALATNYNVLAPDFLDKREMLNYEFSDAVKPSRSMTHWIECKPGELVSEEKTVRAGTIPVNADLRMYDHGNLFLAVGGNTAAGSIIGMLWISYDVEFYFPKISGSASGVVNYYHEVRATAVTATPFGATAGVPDPRNTVACTTTPNSILFPPGLRGDFAFTLMWSGAASTGTGNVALVASGGATILSQFNGLNIVGQTQKWKDTIVRITDDNGFLSMATTDVSLPTAASTCDIKLIQIPRSSPAPSEIFDPKGAESESRYSAFMLRFGSAVSVSSEKKEAMKMAVGKPSYLSGSEVRRKVGDYSISSDKYEGTYCVTGPVSDGTLDEVTLNDQIPFECRFINSFAGLSDKEFCVAIDSILRHH